MKWRKKKHTQKKKRKKTNNLISDFTIQHQIEREKERKKKVYEERDGIEESKKKIAMTNINKD